MGLTANNALDKLLPTTGTWFLDGTFDESVTLHHPVNILTGEPKREYCVVEIAIKRNWIIYFVKQICTMLLCTAGGPPSPPPPPPGQLWSPPHAQLTHRHAGTRTRTRTHTHMHAHTHLRHSTARHGTARHAQHARHARHARHGT